MLEHFDRNRTVIGAGLGRSKSVHVGRDHPDIVEFAPVSFRLDVEALRVGVGHGGNGGFRVVFRHPKSERSPTTTQLQDLLTILELRPIAGEFKHDFLRFREGGVLCWPVPAAILESRAENIQVKLRGNLVVLLVRIGRVDCNRGGIQPGTELRKTTISFLKVTQTFLGQLGGKKVAYTSPNKRIWNQSMRQ